MATASQRRFQRDMLTYEPFETTVRRWAVISAQQLHDAYKTQKIYNGSENRKYEVWTRKKRVRIDSGTVDANGRRRKKYKMVDWGWFDESRHRKMLQQKNPSADYWFSTGASFRETAVEVSNLKEDLNHLLIEGEVRYRTTMQMYYAESGVGANGRKNVRGRSGIKVDTADPFSWRYRYVTDWIPKKGHTHRPSVRQQVFYMRKRMAWLAKHNFNFILNSWLQVSLTDMLDTKTNTIHLPMGVGMSIHPETKK